MTMHGHQAHYISKFRHACSPPGAMQLLLDDGTLTVQEETVQRSRLLARLSVDGANEIVPVHSASRETVQLWAGSTESAGTASVQEVFHVIMVRAASLSKWQRMQARHVRTGHHAHVLIDTLSASLAVAGQPRPLP